MHKFAVLIGRFQPFHNGHLELVRAALTKAQQLIILIGSKDCTPSPKNPFTAAQRQQMIINSLSLDEARKVSFAFILDHLYDDRAWVSEVRQAVEALTNDSEDITLVGHQKDASSGYLAYFRDWTPTFLPATSDGLSATDIREAMFEGRDDLIQGRIPVGTEAFLTRYYPTDRYADMREEYEALKAYKEAWAGSPYPPIFTTVDTVVTFADYVLLVKRGDRPGKGNWAIPGGFLNPDESLAQAALRELGEETSVALGMAHFQLKAQHVFDHPQRSLRGRVITHAYHYEADNCVPPVAGDDAADAKWFPIHKLASIRSQLHDDHLFILEHFLGAVK